jgi:Pup amidohydrolase
VDWADSRVAMIDLQYHDIRPGKGLYNKLEQSDAVERIASDEEIARAVNDPPRDTRAYFRGMCLQRYSEDIVSASWDSVLFDLKEGPLKKIFMLEPLRGTEALVRRLFDQSPTARDLLKNISKPTIV